MTAPNVPNASTGIVPSLHGYLRSLTSYIDDSFRRRTPDDQARHSVLLVSPGGLVYSVQVQDDGTLITELVQG